MRHEIKSSFANQIDHGFLGTFNFVSVPKVSVHLSSQDASNLQQSASISETWRFARKGSLKQSAML